MQTFFTERYITNYLFPQGFAHIATSASLLDNVEIPADRVYKITSWSIPPASGNLVSGATFNGGLFTAPYSGIYNVFTSVTITPENGLSVLKIGLNGKIFRLY